MAQRRDRQLAWDACFNVRDIGGYTMQSGGCTRWGRFVRADNLRRLTPAGRAALVDYGVRTVIDLRAPFELQIDPSPFAPSGALPDAVKYLHLPILDPKGTDQAAGAAIDAAASVEVVYALLLEQCHEQFGAIIRAIAAAPDGAVLVYCHAGKDRTGLISALVLATAGVQHTTIAQDYALSDRCLQPLYEAQLQQERDAAKRLRLKRQLRSPLNAARPSTMLATLAHLDERHGGATSYLRRSGVASAELERLRARLGG